MVVVFASAGVALAAWFGWFRPAREPVVRFGQPIPADVEAEARAAVADYVGVFAARRACAPPADVVLVRDVEGGDARYVAEDGRVEIEIPTTPARFRESLVHELAHHLEHRCADFGELREAWLAQAGGAWSGHQRWEDRPSEQWAEAVVDIVLGERILHGDEMVLDPELVALVREWADG